MMTSKKLRQEFLDFFEKKGHKIVASSSLLPTDSTVLFTSAGMQQFKPYYLGEKSPYGLNVASCQKCFRTSDIEEVGDSSHLTFIEMLGNFSFGSYFKEEAISAAYELLNSKFKIQNSKMTITVFDGDSEVPRDEESVRIWSKFGFSEKKGNLRFAGREDNFWGPTGQEGPCGPTTEIYLQNTEVWNLVFNEYYQDRNKKLTPLKQKGVDTGMGLERLTMIVQGKSNVFETDLFEPIIKEISKNSSKPYTLNPKPYRIIADHIKAAMFLISEGIFPSNMEQGYILRRILRRAIRHGKILGLSSGFLIPLAKEVIEIYKDIYPELKSQETDILTVIQKEEEKFSDTLEKGLKEFEKIADNVRIGTIRNFNVRIGTSRNSNVRSGTIQNFRGEISGQDAFHLYDTFGFPLEMTEEIAQEKGLKVDKKGFEQAFKKHQEISRAGAEKKFRGTGKETTYAATKLHTATHLLHAALREVLGEQVKQMGSDITVQRLRFDFLHSQKLTEDEIKKVEQIVNQKIKQDLEVRKEEMKYEEALKSGALAFFREKYPENVNVYSIGSFSKEICAGPHVSKTSELCGFKIIKEESSGSGVRRIRAILK